VDCITGGIYDLPPQAILPDDLSTTD
ncbi:hypothetical protein A2U01_0094956, partial [Trifolium medium]|nr:hypothetical protein [Trifolium medium]